MSRIAELHAGLRPQLEVVVTRVFDASAELVFRMWTEPEHFARWWGPKGFTNPVCELDARPGGAILVHMRAPNGAVYPLAGTFREIVPCERLVFTFIAEDGEGNAALDEITTVTFAAEGSKTRVTVRSKAVGLAPAAPAMLAGMEKGWSQSMDRLATSVFAKAANGAVVGEDEAQIRKVLADRARALHDKDAGSCRGPPRRGCRDVHARASAAACWCQGARPVGLEAWFATWRGPIGWELRDPDIAVGG